MADQERRIFCLRFAARIAAMYPEDYSGADSIINLADKIWRFVDRAAHPE